VATTNNPNTEQSSIDSYPERSFPIRKEHEESVSPRNEWAYPESEDQVAFLAVTNARSFEFGQKSKVESILASFSEGDALGAKVYEVCAAELDTMDSLSVEHLPPLPRTWYEFRSKHAAKYGWSRTRFIKALLDRDKLMEHLQYHLRQASRNGQSGPLGYGSYSTPAEGADEDVSGIPF
jgi:hypothetical protein